MSSTTMSPVKVGIIGYGNSARVFHLPHILSVPELSLVAFFQRARASNDDKPKSSDDYPNCKHYHDFDKFLADENIELVVVTTRDDSHADLSIAALEAGKNVVCEKPLGQTSEQVLRMLEAQKRSGKILFPFQNRRYDSDFRTVQRVIQSGALGDIHEMALHYDWDLPAWIAGMGDKPYTPGAGMMFGIGCHKLDQALALFGRPSTVTGFYRALRPGAGDSKIDDTFTIVLHYPKSGPHRNLEVVVKCNVINKTKHQFAYFVRGTKGSFLKLGEDPQEAQVQSGMKPSDEGYGEEDEDIWGDLASEDRANDSQVKRGSLWCGKVKSEKGSWGMYYRDVAKAVRGDPVVVKAETSADGIRIIELARESAEKGRSMVFEA
ncbi:oxidoreductase [Kockovaella imperatae]|uniref:Oxidoreductase n=1 Tax=Kockovaella imperatae TaxID=4999 RepID=A0A1Y1ULS1_9TREE|nr:oxidoreductase [Kockovaella imperatae]ORX38075.1 oxidoreductase [Kockovaella imperatae]